MGNKIYLACQMYVSKQEQFGHTFNIEQGLIVRRVEANSKEEAIGKFILQTTHIKAMKKMDIECYLLNEVIQLT